MSNPAVAYGQPQEFRHEALLYSGEDGFLAGTVPFIHDGVSRGEIVLVVVDAKKIALLREELSAAADGVVFADMAAVGRNPACIIPLWRQFVAKGTADGRGVRGIGEPVFPARSPAELVECQIHESLLNIAFRDASAWWLICPYDTDALPSAVVDEALRSHPSFTDDEGRRDSPGYSDHPAHPLDGPPLPAPQAGYVELAFGQGDLGEVRAFVASHASALGLTNPSRIGELSLAVHELTANSIRHGGGRGTLRVWREAGDVVCEVQDAGTIEEPLVGREIPTPMEEHGRGLWLVNQLADLTRLRSSASGTAVRIHIVATGA